MSNRTLPKPITLPELSALLRDRTRWPKQPEDFVWNYATTSHCALGLARRVTEIGFPDQSIELGTLSAGQAEEIFVCLRDKDGCMGGVTPEQVADAIDAALRAED